MVRKQIAYIILVFLILNLSFVFSACKKNHTIVQIDHDKLTLKDFLFDIYIIEQDRKIWNEKYKEILGTDYWDYEFNGMTMEQISKNTIMAKVVYHEILSRQAKKEGYALNKVELADSEANADKLLSSMSDKDINNSGITRDVLIKSYNKLALADKYYSAITSGFKVDEEAIKSTIDPEEYREYVTECLYIPTAEVNSGRIISYGESEIKEAYDNILYIMRLIQNGNDFDTVLDTVDGIMHYKRSFILSDSTAEKEYKEAVRNLDNGDYSDVITTQFGYYIIHMLDNNSTVRYEEATERAVMNEKAALFEIHYEKLLQDYDIKINSEYWDSIDLGSVTSEG